MSNKYNIIYADPPWPIKIISRIVRPKQLDMPYKTMTLDEIKRLNVLDLADKEECHLFLWATQKYLPYAFGIMNDWGFKYNCTITWDKTYGFTPFSFMWSTEFLLYGQLSGKWKKPIGVGKIKTCITHKPSGHSVKPDIFRQKIVEFCGDKPRVELFAREKKDGWDVWGNEVESDVSIPEMEYAVV